jgi:hypothetical protein
VYVKRKHCILIKQKQIDDDIFISRDEIENKREIEKENDQRIAKTSYLISTYSNASIKMQPEATQSQQLD